MTHSLIAAGTVATLLCTAGQAPATQFGIEDPRTLAMGGVGVSAADSLGAVGHNPALLSALDGHAFILGLPVYADRSVDAGDLSDDLYRLELPGRTLRLEIGDLNLSTAAGDIAQAQLDAGRIATRMAEVDGELQRTRNKSLDEETFVGVLLARPDRKLGIGLQIAKRTEFAADYVTGPGDSALLANLSALAAAYAVSGAPADLAALRAAMDLDGDGALDDPALGSRLRVRGIVLDEVAIAVAHRLDWLGGIDVGATPKLVRATTVDYEISALAVQADIDLDRGRLQADGFNLDLGLAKDIAGGYRAGLVARNVLRKSYRTASGSHVELRPQLRAGISHHGDRSSVGFDLDLTENDHSGLGTATQFAALGLEYGMGAIQLRAGYRHDLAGRYRDIVAAGVGIDVAGLRFELGLAGNAQEFSIGLMAGVSL